MSVTLREAGLGVVESAHDVLARSKPAGLSSSAWLVSVPGWAREMFEERAAIMEFDGELTRAEAERRARAAAEGFMNSARLNASYADGSERAS